MRFRSRLPVALLLLLTVILAACDTDATPTPVPTSIPTQAQATETIQVTPTTLAQPPSDTPTSPGGQPAGAQTPAAQTEATGTPVDAAQVTEPPTPGDSAPSPTPVTATSTGAEMTALQALAMLKPKALAWHSDARLGMLANTRPDQQKSLLAGALGSPDVNEPTPGGKGRNWTLVAFSPSAKGSIAISMDGTKVDLVKGGAVSTDVVNGFVGNTTEVAALSTLDPSTLQDSDKIVAQAGNKASGSDVGIALLEPDGLGLGPLPTPQAGGQSPQLAYELFVQSGAQQSFIFYDAKTGAVVLDSTSP